MKLDTTFAGLKAVETVTFSQESDGAWRAIGYLIVPAYVEASKLRSKARQALFFSGLSGILGIILFCFRHTPIDIFDGAILGAALLGIFEAIPTRKTFLGKIAMVVGSINTAIWFFAFAICTNHSDKPLQTQATPTEKASQNSSPRPEAASLSQEGWQLWKAGKLTEAATTFKQAVELAPDDANSWNGLGWALFNSGQTSEAEKAFQKALGIEPNHPAALNGLGQIYLFQRNYAEAENFLLKAASQNAPAAWYGLARLYLLQSKFAEAEQWAQKVVDSGQGDDIAQKMLDAAKEKHLNEALRRTIEPPAPPSQ